MVEIRENLIGTISVITLFVVLEPFITRFTPTDMSKVITALIAIIILVNRKRLANIIKI